MSSGKLVVSSGKLVASSGKLPASSEIYSQDSYETCSAKFNRAIAGMKLEMSATVIYTCRPVLGGIVSNILGHPRHTAFVAPCS